MGGLNGIVTIILVASLAVPPILGEILLGSFNIRGKTLLVWVVASAVPAMVFCIAVGVPLIDSFTPRDPNEGNRAAGPAIWLVVFTFFALLSIAPSVVAAMLYAKFRFPK